MASSDNLLSHISFSSMVDHYKEMLVSNYWTMQVVKWPAAAYHPQETLIKNRIQGIDGIVEPEAGMLDYTARGFSSYQTGQTAVPQSDISFTFLDYEDATILYWARSWRDCQHFWEEFVANRLEYCVAEIKVFRCSKEGRAVREYFLKRVLFNSLQYQDNFTETSDLIGNNVSVNCRAIVKSNILNANNL